MACVTGGISGRVLLRFGGGAEWRLGHLLHARIMPLAQQSLRLRLQNYSNRLLIPQTKQAIPEKSMRLERMSEIKGIIYPDLVLSKLFFFTV